MVTDSEKPRSPKVGKLRPSQVVTQHGPGAVVDLPELSVIVGGTNYWHPTGIDRVYEPRFEAFLRVRALYRPPQPTAGKFGGLPSFVFPEWLVCPRCRLLAPLRSFSFRSSSGDFVCTRNDHRRGNVRPAAFAARFMVACAAGHVDDFPWQYWARAGSSMCTGPLELVDIGSSGSAADLIVKCTSCNLQKPLGGAFQKDALAGCTARRPWLGPSHYDAGCHETVKTILRGASNAYFSVVSSALSIPPWSDPIQQELASYRDQLKAVKSLDHLTKGIEGEFYDVGDLLARYTVEQIWKALQAEPEAEEDLKRREYIAFLHPEAAADGRTEFEITRRAVHNRYANQFSMVVAASRLREVRALRGFTRIDSIPDLGERTDVSELDVRIVPLGLKDVDWLPGIDFRGEGIFIQLDQVRLAAWEAQPAVTKEAARLAVQFNEWRSTRSLDTREFPGMRYVLLHTLAHVLMRQLALDCGYSSSALRERIYCKTGGDPMSGLLIYTASSDSDGSLGGLVDQAIPDRLGPLLMDAMRQSAFCASDPLCGGGEIGAAAHINGAACHACLLLAETSCEFGNRLLDRATLVETLGNRRMPYFETT
jgi:hypothetical protein